MTPQGPPPASGPRRQDRQDPRGSRRGRPRARPPVAAPRAPRPATRCRTASRAGRCRCTCGCPSCGASRTRSASSTRSSTWTGSPSCTPRAARSPSTTWSPRARSARASPSRCSATARSAVALQVTVHAFSAHRQGEDRGRRRLGHRALDRCHSRSKLSRQGRPGRVVPDGCRRGLLVVTWSRTHPARSPRRGRSGRRVQEDPCSPRSLGRSGRPTCARRCSSRWASSRCSGSARVIPTPGRLATGGPGLHRQADGEQQPLQPDQPVQRRRAAAAVDLRARASCRTSRRASSSSCSPW